jgi:hypothetical protein
MLAHNTPVTVIDFEGQARRLRTVASHRSGSGAHGEVMGLVEWWREGRSYNRLTLVAAGEGVGWARGHEPETEAALMAAWRLARSTA